MANVIIAGSASGATPLPVASTIDGVNDYLPIYTASATATQAINRNTLLNIASQPLGLTDTQSPTNKTFNNTNAFTIKDGSLTLQNSSSTTKQATFLLSGITAGQTRIITLPDYNATIASLAGIETLTNKTLTSPTINSPTITNATISSDAITGFTVSNTGTIYGISVTTGQITTSSSVLGAALTNTSVTPNKLNTGILTNLVSTSESTTSTSPVNLTTTGPSVTVTIGVNGLALVIVSADTSNSGSGNFNNMYVTSSGANTVNPNGTNVYAIKSAAANSDIHASYVGLITGLSQGSTTFTAKYSVSAGTGTWSVREMTVLPL